MYDNHLWGDALGVCKGLSATLFNRQLNKPLMGVTKVINTTGINCNNLALFHSVEYNPYPIIMICKVDVMYTYRAKLYTIYDSFNISAECPT